MRNATKWIRECGALVACLPCLRRASLARQAGAPLRAAAALLAVSWRDMVPENDLGRGVASLVTGFVLLLVGIVVNWRHRDRVDPLGPAHPAIG